MKNIVSTFNLFLSALLISTLANAAQDSFQDGPVITGYGKHAAVTQDLKLAKSSTFKLAFDAYKQSGEGQVNSNLNTAARFLNMHIANGIKRENIQMAVVIHGKAAFDVLGDDAYEQRFDKENANKDLLAQLLEHKVDIFVCGQSAAYHKIKRGDLHPGVKMSLSAMTAHALLQQQGYTLNPF